MKLNKIFSLSAVALGLATLVSCSESNEVDTPDNGEEKVYHIGAKFDDDDSQVYLAAVTDLSSGSLTFVDNGYHLNPVRSARVFTGEDGNIYVFNYGGGTLERLTYSNGTYTSQDEIDIAPVMGGKTTVRPRKINEETILFHDIISTDVEDTGNGVIKSPTMYAANIAIPGLSIASTMETWTIPVADWDVTDQAYPFRVDASTILGDKIYYGVGRRSFNSDLGIKLTGMHTIVLDYPDLINPTYIRTDKGNGNTYGYRGPNMHAIDGYIYQANRSTSAEDPTILVRLKDGAYDESWEFNVSEALGEAISTSNWYYAGSGIGYMCAEFFDAEDENNTWGVVRIDIDNKTAVKMNVPMSELFGYQNGVVVDGKFCMAISPVGSTGEAEPAIYMFDISSDSPDAFTKGMTLDKGNIFIEGIY